MDWIKKNYDRFALIVLAVALMGSSGYVIWSTQTFQASFDAALAPVTHQTTLPKLDVAALEEAKKSIATPASWALTQHSGSLFVSRKYLVKDGQLEAPELTGTLNPPVPNQWFFDHGLDPLDSNVLNEDPDGDGYTNLEEWKAGTDPRDKSSRPPYVSKLRLVQWVHNSFRLKFQAYDGEHFQINALDLHQPSQFLKLGESIIGTNFKLLKYEPKKAMVESTGEYADVSELTVKNTETGVEVVLPLLKVVDSPDSQAHFKFLMDGSDFQVVKGGKFSLKVEPDMEYKLIDIQENEAVISSLKNNAQIKVPRVE